MNANVCLVLIVSLIVGDSRAFFIHINDVNENVNGHVSGEHIVTVNNDDFGGQLSIGDRFPIRPMASLFRMNIPLMSLGRQIEQQIKFDLDRSFNPPNARHFTINDLENLHRILDFSSPERADEFMSRVTELAETRLENEQLKNEVEHFLNDLKEKKSASFKFSDSMPIDFLNSMRDLFKKFL